MTAFGYLLGKELRGVFLQPIAWVLMAVLVVLLIAISLMAMFLFWQLPHPVVPEVV